MYSPKEVLKKEPAAISAALVAVVNALVLFGLDWSGEQVAGANLALTAVLALFYVRPLVTPNSKL